MMAVKCKFNIRSYYETLQKNETNNKKVMTHFKAERNSNIYAFRMGLILKPLTASKNI